MAEELEELTEAEIVAKLSKVEGVTEAYHIVSSYRIIRTAEDGSTQYVTLDILDAGPDGRADLRYYCSARSEDGRTAVGNPDKTIYWALSNIHWEHLDIDV